MRLALAVAAGVALAVLSALILGDQLEPEVLGVLPPIAAVLLGVVEAELISGIGQRRDALVRLASGALAAGGMAWGTWIAYDPVPGRSAPLALTSIVAPALAGIVGALAVRTTRTTAADSPTAT